MWSFQCALNECVLVCLRKGAVEVKVTADLTLNWWDPPVLSHQLRGVYSDESVPSTIWQEMGRGLMRVWQHLMARDTLLNDGLNDDSFYVSEKLLRCFKWNVFNNSNTFLWSGRLIQLLIFFPIASLSLITGTLSSASHSSRHWFPHWFTTCFTLAKSLVNSIKSFFFSIWSIT